MILTAIAHSLALVYSSAIIAELTGKPTKISADIGSLPMSAEKAIGNTAKTAAWNKKSLLRL